MVTHRTACILCSRNCGIQVSVEGRRLTSVRGDADHPISKGYLCQKAARLDHYQNHADRLGQPLRRRPDGSFEAVSWDTALREIAAKLTGLRDAHGGKCFAFYGGGGQGNHLGAGYSSGLLAAMGSPYRYNALAQEKTGDFWVNGRLFGRQTCHVSEDVESADFVLCIGTNPWQAHGIPNARDTLRALSRDPARTLVVIDPRRTETARLADMHVQLRPGTDAFLLAALLAVLVRDGLLDRGFLARRTRGLREVEAALREVPIADFVSRADVPLAQVEWLAHGFARARSACVRVDLGLQQSLHSTLNSYLEKLVFLLTGQFAKPGGNNLHSFFVPLFEHSGEGERTPRTVHAGMPAIAGLFPPNLLPAEIDNGRSDRVRALVVDSANPVVSGADTAAYEQAMAKLELLVVVDVALTETARFAHYVLPAASQYEKWEATGFNFEFPRNFFHLRAPILPAYAESLPEPEIYTRLLREMGALPRAGVPWLAKLARRDRRVPRVGLFLAGLAAAIARRPAWLGVAPNILYETIGPALEVGSPAAATLWVLAHAYALQHHGAVRRAGFRGRGLALGENLYRAIAESRSGTIISEHRHADTWSLLRHRDRRVHLAIPELLCALRELSSEAGPDTDVYPFVLIAGERRAYNANTLYRDPAWRKNDPEGSIRIHPDDADRLGLADGAPAQCRSPRGEIQVTILRDASLRSGVLSLPHGYGLRYAGGAPVGPELNRLTWSAHCDPIAATPFHKHIQVQLTPI